jgi:hypothetical protein
MPKQFHNLSLSFQKTYKNHLYNYQFEVRFTHPLDKCCEHSCPNHNFTGRDGSVNAFIFKSSTPQKLKLSLKLSLKRNPIHSL